jgi:hypothetical protein
MNPVENIYFTFISNMIKYNQGFKLDSLKSYLEIGVCDGFSIQCMIREFPSIEKVVLSDTWGNEFGGSDKGNHDHIIGLLASEGFDLAKVIFLDGDSKDTIPTYFALNDGEFDLIYVDGDHTPLGCLSDITNCIKHCKILAVHDVRHPLYSFIRELCYSFYETIKNEFIMIDNGEYLIYFVKKDLFQWI